MMNTPVKCDCGCEFEVSVESLGVEAPCPACGKMISVSQAANPADSAAARSVPPTRRTPRWARILVGCFGVIALVAVVSLTVGGVLITRWFAESKRRLEEEVAILAGSSEPSTPEDLEAYYCLPAGVVDTTELWMDATDGFDTDEFRQEAELLKRIRSEEVPLVEPGHPWDQLAEARALLDKYQAAMDGLHEAARLGGAARYESRFEDGFFSDVSVVNELRDAGQMLQLEAYVKSHEGDSQGTIRSIRTLLRLSRSLENSPQVVDQLVRIAIARIAYETLAALLPHLDAGDQALAELISELSEDDFNQGLVNGLLGERVNGLLAFDHPETMMNDSDVDVEKLQQWSQNWRTRDRAFYLRHMRRLIDAARDPWPDKLASARQVEDELEQMLHGSNKLVQLQHLLSLFLAPAGNAVFNATASATALRDAAMTLVAIERYRAIHGRPPESLDQLVPDFIAKIPVDPFDGQPLRYRADPDRYVVYSVGENRQDDGGDPGENGRLDVVLSVVTTPEGGSNEPGPVE